MAVIVVSAWKEHPVRFTGWGDHVRVEMRKRLAKGLSGSPHRIKTLAKKIQSRQLVTFKNVRDSSVEGIRQLLEDMGAEVRVIRP